MLPLPLRLADGSPEAASEGWVGNKFKQQSSGFTAPMGFRSRRAEGTGLPNVVQPHLKSSSGEDLE